MDKDQLNFEKGRKKNTGDKNNIYELNTQILELFEQEYNSLPSLKKKCNKFKWIYDNADNENDKQRAFIEWVQLSEKVDTIESGFREAKYIHQVEPLLKEYDKLLERPVKVDFMGNKVFDQQDKKEIITADFLNIAANYININPIQGKLKQLICEDCNVDFQREDDFIFICPICGFEYKLLTSNSGYNENSRINTAQRYVYEKRVHFGDSIKKYQGIQNTTISANVYQDISSKIKSHEIPLENFTKEHLYHFLKSTGHSDHYENMTLIYYEITGIKPPDISHLESKLYEFFDQIEPIYERIKSPERSNFLNGQFILYKLLQKLRYPCKEEDFYILKTRDKMLEHDQIWKKICKELSWTFIPTV